MLGAARRRPACAPRCAPRRPSPSRSPAFALALLGGGVADELLRPDRWGELMPRRSGRGLTALPGVRVPYRGLDEWTRIVITLGGTVLSVLAAIVAFWPRAHGLGCAQRRARAAGDAVRGARGRARPRARVPQRRAAGRARASPTCGWSDRGSPTPARPAMLAVGVAILGLVAAPALDTDEPWFDYETWALTNASAKSTSFSWDHTYGPLDWPRDGRELLRVKARRARLLEGAQPRRVRRRALAARPSARTTSTAATGPRPRTRTAGCSGSRVSVRNLRSQTFVTAGIACAVDGLRLPRIPLGDGTYAIGDRTLRRGDAYRALVYTPAPTERERRAAGDDVPPFIERFTRDRAAGARPRVARACASRSATSSQFPLCGARRPAAGATRSPSRARTRRPARELLARQPLRAHLAARAAAAARSREHAARTTSRRVAALPRRRRLHLHRVAARRARENLDGFLFDAKSGYCQQYSGAMALLLRMGGVPARVVDRLHDGLAATARRGEYVVRDLDAHSWVEVWYPGDRLGDVRPDARRRARPLAARRGRRRPPAPPRSRRAPDLGGDIRSDPSRQVRGRRARARRGR